MSLFVLASKDGWVNIMYHGLDAVGIDQQVEKDTYCETLRQKHIYNTQYVKKRLSVVSKFYEKM